MSNKKRIKKRISQLERLQWVRFAKAFENCAIQAEKAGAKIAKMLSSVYENKDALKRIVQVFDEHQQGIFFTGIINDSEFDDFVFNMRKLTGYSEAYINNLCISLPKEHWKTVEGLVTYGFSLEDAVAEIIETFRL